MMCPEFLLSTCLTGTFGIFDGDHAMSVWAARDAKDAIDPAHLEYSTAIGVRVGRKGRKGRD